MAGPNLPESITAGVTADHHTDHQKISDLLNEFDLDGQVTTKGDLLVYDGSLYKRLPVGADGTALVSDSAETLGVKWGSGGGGWVADPNLKPPDTPHADDLEFQTMANGTTTATMGLTWLNQGTRTAEVQGGRLVLNVPAAETVYGGIGTDAPASGNFTFTVRHRSWPIQNYHGTGVFAVNDSPAGTYANYRYMSRWLADNNVYLTSVSSSWTYSSNPASTAHSYNRAEHSYERLVWTGEATGTLSWQLTADPLAGWMNRWTSGTINRPTYLGATMTGESSSTYDLLASHDFWRFDWTPDYSP